MLADGMPVVLSISATTGSRCWRVRAAAVLSAGVSVSTVTNRLILIQPPGPREIPSLHEPYPPHPILLPSGGEGARRAVEGDSDRFMVPMHAETKRKGALHEPWFVWSSASRRLEPLGPAEAGTPSCHTFHGPNARSQNRGGFP